jgi:hypothetical protein
VIERGSIERNERGELDGGFRRRRSHMYHSAGVTAAVLRTGGIVASYVTEG